MGRRYRSMVEELSRRGPIEGLEVIADKEADIKPPSYRVTPGAWIVANLYGRIAPTPWVAYWPAETLGDIALTSGGSSVAAHV